MSLSTLMLETIFTRLIALILGAELSYVAVSVAMLGLTSGALAVYAFPQWREKWTLHRQLTVSALLFASTIPISILVLFLFPVGELSGWMAKLTLGLEFLFLTLPFLFSGWNITLVLTSHGKQFRKLYAADLFGAALGCIIFLLSSRIFSVVEALLFVILLGYATSSLYSLAQRTLFNKTLPFLLIATLIFLSNLVFGWISLEELTGVEGMLSSELMSGFDAVNRPQNLLETLLAITAVIFVCFLFGPLFLKSGKVKLKQESGYMAYFALIGIGFMLVEISQLQNLTVLLGDPAYSITIVLSTLLLSTGLGSFLGHPSRRKTGLSRLLVLILVVVVTGVCSYWVLDYTSAMTLVARIGMAVGILLPMGIALGMAMPLGMRYALKSRPSLTPWFWALNGAASVFASILGIYLAQVWGQQSPFWLGIAAYAFAGVSYWRFSK